MKLSTLIVVFSIVSLVLLPTFDSWAQESKSVVQFSGVVAGEDTLGVPGVHIYVPLAGRGTTTNQYGYFSMPALVGDSVIISAIGYHKQYYIIPKGRGESVTVGVTLEEDTTMLPLVEIFPYPTEAAFKEAILALQLPDTYDRKSPNMGEDVLARMLKDLPMDGGSNHRYFMDQQFFQMHNRYSDPRYNNPLLNPFNWAKFIKSIKDGDLKEKRE